MCCFQTYDYLVCFVHVKMCVFKVHEYVCLRVVGVILRIKSSHSCDKVLRYIIISKHFHLATMFLSLLISRSKMYNKSLKRA